MRLWKRISSTAAPSLLDSVEGLVQAEAAYEQRREETYAAQLFEGFTGTPPASVVTTFVEPTIDSRRTVACLHSGLAFEVSGKQGRTHRVTLRLLTPLDTIPVTYERTAIVFDRPTALAEYLRQLA